jgi:hypothetical protein
MSRYTTPLGFKEALEARLRAACKVSGQEQNRLRMRLVIDRFAARVSAEFGDDVVLKGGVVLELRLAEARATKDLDLRLVGDPELALGRLQSAGRIALDDHLAFEVRADPRHPTIEAEGMRYEGLRFRVQGRLAGKAYGGPFGVDAAFAEPMVGQPELLQGSDFLSFADVAPAMLRVYPLESHIAEKLHAYTVPRPRPNSRVKDLPDLALLARVRKIDARTLRGAIVETFAYRATHDVPSELPAPAEGWRRPYARLATRDALPWSDLDVVTAAARGFLDPMLAGDAGVWGPRSWRWEDGG